MSVDDLESTVAQQSRELEELRYRQDPDDGMDDADGADGVKIPDEEFHKNFEEIQALEARKKILEEKLSGLDEDLGEMMG